MKPHLLILLFTLTALQLSHVTAISPPNAETANFHGFTQHNFKVNDLNCRLVAPEKAAKGNPWIWRARFFGHQPQADVALLNAGYHIAFCDVANLFGNAEAIDRWNRFYQYATTELGLAKRPALEGMSRGGLIIFNWAAANPDKVACIYGDAPVCSLLSWPLGKVEPGKKNKAAETCLAAYGFDSLDAFKAAPPKMPLDHAALLAKKKIPVLLVVGLADDVVPYADNGELFAKTYRDNDGPIEVIKKPNIGHHPHSLEDPAPIVEFVKNNTL